MQMNASTRKPITGHALARLLLTLPDHPVAVTDGEGGGEWIVFAQAGHVCDEHDNPDLSRPIVDLHPDGV